MVDVTLYCLHSWRFLFWVLLPNVLVLRAGMHNFTADLAMQQPALCNWPQTKPWATRLLEFLHPLLATWLEHCGGALLSLPWTVLWESCIFWLLFCFVFSVAFYILYLSPDRFCTFLFCFPKPRNSFVYIDTCMLDCSQRSVPWKVLLLLGVLATSIVTVFNPFHM